MLKSAFDLIPPLIHMIREVLKALCDRVRVGCHISPYESQAFLTLSLPVSCFNLSHLIPNH